MVQGTKRNGKKKYLLTMVGVDARLQQID